MITLFSQIQHISSRFSPSPSSHSLSTSPASTLAFIFPFSFPPLPPLLLVLLQACFPAFLFLHLYFPFGLISVLPGESLLFSRAAPLNLLEAHGSNKSCLFFWWCSGMWDTCLAAFQRQRDVGVRRKGFGATSSAPGSKRRFSSASLKRCRVPLSHFSLAHCSSHGALVGTGKSSLVWYSAPITCPLTWKAKGKGYSCEGRKLEDRKGRVSARERCEMRGQERAEEGRRVRQRCKEEQILGKEENGERRRKR